MGPLSPVRFGCGLLDGAPDGLQWRTRGSSTSFCRAWDAPQEGTGIREKVARVPHSPTRFRSHNNISAPSFRLLPATPLARASAHSQTSLSHLRSLLPCAPEPLLSSGAPGRLFTPTATRTVSTIRARSFCRTATLFECLESQSLESLSYCLLGGESIWQR